MDKTTFRILLISLASFELGLIAASFFLLNGNKDVPEWMSTAIAAVITGILGLAVHTTPADPQPVINAPGAPVEVVNVPAPTHRAEDDDGLIH